MFQKQHKNGSGVGGREVALRRLGSQTVRPRPCECEKIFGSEKRLAPLTAREGSLVRPPELPGTPSWA